MRRLLGRWKQLLISIVIGVSVVAAGWSRVGQATTASAPVPAWAAPTAMALRKVSDTSGAQSEPYLLSNLDCTLLTYHLVADSAMRTGCFSEAAYGMVDTDSGTVIFNGTDEGLPLLPYSNQELLVPWPKALDVLALDTATTGGSYVNLYKNPHALLEDQRNVLAQLTAKKLTAPPEQHLLDNTGKPLIAIVQTLTFADSGSWLVAEAFSGSFLRINLATLDVLPFAHSFATQGSPGLLKSQAAISSDGHFSAINNEAAGSFKVYDVTSCSSNEAGNCPSRDYRSYIKQRLPGLQSIRHVRFVNDGLISFEGTSSSIAESGSTSDSDIHANSSVTGVTLGTPGITTIMSFSTVSSPSSLNLTGTSGTIAAGNLKGSLGNAEKVSQTQLGRVKLPSTSTTFVPWAKLLRWPWLLWLELLVVAWWLTLVVVWLWRAWRERQYSSA